MGLFGTLRRKKDGERSDRKRKRRRIIYNLPAG